MNLLDFFSVNTAYARVPQPVANFVGKVNRYITNPIIIFMFAAALVYFLYGVVEFLMNAETAEGRETGKSHMLWGLVGMFIMFGVFTILKIIQTTIGAPVNPNIP